MKENLLKIIPVWMFIVILLTIFQYFGVSISTEIDLVIKSICQNSFSFCISLLVFCCLSNKNEGLSHLGVGLVVGSIFLSIVSYFMLKNISNVTTLKVLFKVKEINRAMIYFIHFLRYMGILLLIDSDEDKAKSARAFAIISLFLYDSMNIIVIWTSLSSNSIFYNIRSCLYDFFQLFTVIFIVFKFFGDKFQSVQDNVSAYDMSLLNSHQQVTVKNVGVMNPISTNGTNIVANLQGGNNVSQVGISSVNTNSSQNTFNDSQNIGVSTVNEQNSVQSISNSVSSNDIQSGDSLFSEFVIVPSQDNKNVTDISNQNSQNIVSTPNNVNVGAQSQQDGLNNRINHS